MGDGFTFKRFDIRQEGAAMKVGTDGVLLGAWCTVTPGMRRILDAGTGTGLIALMLAQRTEGLPSAALSGDGVRINAVEIEPGAAEQARRNVEASPWGERMAVVCDSLQHFAGNRTAVSNYDLIVSNPPYFTETLLCPDPTRTAARHTTQLSYDDLLDAAERLLAPGGRLAVVLPADRAGRFTAMARVRCLHLSRRTDVCSRPGAAPKRALLEYRNARSAAPTAAASAVSPVERGALVIAGPQGFTAEYRALTRDFYLDF